MSTGLEFAKRVTAVNKLSPAVVEAAAFGTLDYISSTFMGLDSSEVRSLREWVRCQGVVAQGRYPIGWGVPTTPANAALVNGVQAHAVDIDDVHPTVRGHPSAVILSALFAVADHDTAGVDFLDAYVAGVETMATLGRIMNPYHYAHGWHSTATLGALGAAAAVSRLSCASPRETAMAISLAGSQAGGLRLQFGTSGKPLHVGIAARTGVTAVEWIQAGLTANPDFLDPELGFAAVYGDGAEVDVDGLLDQWGQPFAIEAPGLWFKRYPFCGAALSGAEAAQIVTSNRDFRRDAVVGVEVGFPAGADAALIYQSPTTGEQGRFSIEYIVACILDDAPLTIESFGEKPVGKKSGHTMSLVRRSTMHPSEYVDFGHDTRPTTVTVEMADGERLTSTVAVPLGSSTRPLDAEQRRQKLSDSLGGPIHVDAVIERIESLATQRLGRLLAVLRQISDSRVA